MKKIKTLLQFIFKTNVKKTDSSRSFEETGFKKVTDEKGTFYVVGNNIVAQAKNAEDEKRIEKALASEDWDLLIPIIGVIVKSIMQIETDQKQTA